MSLEPIPPPADLPPLAAERWKELTPEQQRARMELRARQEKLQKQGVPQPKSGTWGGKPQTKV